PPVLNESKGHWLCLSVVCMYILTAAPVLFKKELESQEATEGGKATLSCETSSPDCKVTWRKGSTVLTHGEKYTMEQRATTHTLVIHKLNVEDSGEYSNPKEPLVPPRFLERFSNRKVKQGASITLSVKVEGLFISLFHLNMIISQLCPQDFHKFPCYLSSSMYSKFSIPTFTFLGSPTPMVSWLKEESLEDVLWIKPDTKGYKIASSGRQHSLILMDVGTEYTGAYTCIATNRAGQSICTAHLEVDDSNWTCICLWKTFRLLSKRLHQFIMYWSL
uniref:Ig-like domain-containing protein n=1 Tax=Seriola dumerili TaxID=41447 RepID=A0A3B4V017_SERDU